MGLLAIFGIHNDALNRVVSLLILFLVVVYLALIYWTFADARRRIADPMLVVCATLCSVIPFAGTIVYMIVRPPEYLEDARERELEIAAAEARLAQLETGCPYCGFRVEPEFLRCPSCLRKLKEPCHTCGKPLDPLWKICPYCESEIAGVPPTSEPTRRRSGRRASAAASTLAAEQEPTSRYETRGDSGATARTRPPSA
jgi:DNA-directed RNA polymerase subunit RPC12/RpoP